MKHNFDQLSLKQLYLFRVLYASFSVLVIILIFIQALQEAEQIKTNIASDFSDKVKLVENTILAAQNQILELTSLYNSGSIKSDTLSFSAVEDRFVQKYGYYNKQTDQRDPQWNMFGTGSIDNLSIRFSEEASVFFQIGRILPINFKGAEYSAAALIHDFAKLGIVYPNYSMEKLSESLSSYGSGNFWQNGRSLFGNTELAFQLDEARWLAPQLSLIYNEPVLPIVANLYDKENRRQTGIGILYVDIDVFKKYIETVSDIESEVALTVNDGKQQHLIAYTGKYRLEKKFQDSALLKSPITDYLPEWVSNRLDLSDKWIVLDDDYFLISLPLSNAAFRLTFYSRNLDFYLANPSSQLVRIGAVFLILLFGLIIDYIIRERFLTPMSALHQALDGEREKLERTLSDLTKAQDELVESEKLASLGQLVAGVAHEINTPIGIAVTAASQGQGHLDSLRSDFADNKLTKSKFERLLAGMQESNGYVVRNLSRAADLINNFKQISSDRSTDEKRAIWLGDYVEKTIDSLQPQLRRLPIVTRVICNQDTEIETIPGAISQIITNLVLNAAVHAYGEDCEFGEIMISVTKSSDKHMQISVKDFGKGMSEEVKSNVFQPFFTTKRGKGGTGLGMSICYNLINQSLQGAIEFKSSLGQGTEFIVTLPMAISE